MSIESEILVQAAGAAEVQHELDKLAHEVCEYAKSLAPVFGETGHDERRGSPPEGEPGDYRDSIHVEKVHRDPDVRRVISRDYKAIWIEIGTRHMPEYAVFTKTGAYFGSDTGPSFAPGSGRRSMEEEGVAHAHKSLREELEHLAKLTAEGAAVHEIDAARSRVSAARLARSAAFRAAQPRRGRRR
jgi:hypothetical protein